MAYDEVLAHRIRELLADEPGLARRRCSAGSRFCSREHGRRSERPGRPALRADPEGGEKLIAEGPARPLEMRGREMTGWLRVDEAEVRTKPRLARWVELGAAYARSLPPK